VNGSSLLKLFIWAWAWKSFSGLFSTTIVLEMGFYSHLFGLKYFCISSLLVCELNFPEVQTQESSTPSISHLNPNLIFVGLVPHFKKSFLRKTLKDIILLLWLSSRSNMDWDAIKDIDLQSVFIFSWEFNSYCWIY
jgi:hypothetical protein